LTPLVNTGDALSSGIPGQAKNLSLFQNRWLLIAGWVAVLFTADLFLNRQVIRIVSPGGYRQLHLNDFRHIYAASSVYLEGGNFYDPAVLRVEAARRGVERLNPYVYPPLLAVAASPLAWLTFEQAGWVWYSLNLLLALATVFIFARLLNHFSYPWALAAALFIMGSSEPLTRTLTAGQLNVVLLFLLACSYRLIQKQRPIGGGICLGLATAIKVFPALLIVMLFWRRQWRAAWTAFIAAAVLTLFSSLAAGAEVSLDFLDMVRQMGYGSSTWAELGMHFHIHPANQSPAALITRLLTLDPGKGVNGIVHLPGLAKILCYLMAFMILGILFRFTRPQPNRTRNRQEINGLAFLLALMASLLLPSLVWDHYLVIALLPFIVLLSGENQATGRPWFIILLTTAVILINMHFNFGNPAYSGGWAVALASVKLPGSLILFSLLLWQINQKQKQSQPA
jgi:hypothetical protein